MSIFLCARCDELRDADDGCEEAPASKYGKFQLLCVDCLNDLEDEAFEKAMSPDYSRQGIFQTHNCAYCRDGELPCKQGGAHRCDNLRARND